MRMNGLCMIVLCVGLAACKFPTADRDAPAYEYGATTGGGSLGVHIVRPKETLYQIAERYRLPLRDIMDLNALEPPYVLPAGQRLKLPPPREYTVRDGDTVQSVAQLFSVSPTDLAQINDLRSPYTLRLGQVLRLPSLIKPVPEVSVASVTDTSIDSAPLAPLPTPDMPIDPNQSALDVAGLPAPAPQTPTAPGSPADLTVSSLPQSSKAIGATKPVRIKSVPPLAGKFIKPVQGQIVSGFGPKGGGLSNDGVNIRAARGAPVRAAENGVIAYVGSQIEGFGNLILVKHDEGYITAYGHLDKALVKRGDKVARGQAIATVGSTGTVESPQLHFEIRRGRTPLDPASLLGT